MGYENDLELSKNCNNLAVLTPLRDIRNHIKIHMLMDIHITYACHTVKLQKMYIINEDTMVTFVRRRVGNPGMIGLIRLCKCKTFPCNDAFDLNTCIYIRIIEYKCKFW